MSSSGSSALLTRGRENASASERKSSSLVNMADVAAFARAEVVAVMLETGAEARDERSNVR